MALTSESESVFTSGEIKSTRCPRHCSRKRSITFTRFGWHKTETLRRARLTASSALVRDKYSKAMRCLAKDREKLLVLNSFPAAHFAEKNPVESKFATIRHLDKRSKGCLSRDAMLSMMFKLGICAKHNWRRLRGFRQLGKVIERIQFLGGNLPQTQQFSFWQLFVNWFIEYQRK